MKKKGQEAMEFLMTYGWAILVVIAAIAALAYFGVIGGGPNSTVCCKTTPGVPNATSVYEPTLKEDCSNTLPDGNPRIGATREIVSNSLCH
jgi:uncharacterized protein (UPF0333 family)